MTSAEALEALQAFNLNTIPRGHQIVDRDGRATVTYQLWDQRKVEAIEAIVAAIAVVIEELTAAVDDVQAAQIRAATLAAMARTRDSAASSLTVTGGATSITVSNHSRTYLEPTETVSVTGDTISGLTAATTYYVHYTDSEYEGGAVGYQVSETYEGAIATETEPYRHFVGKATTGGGAGTPDPEPYWKKGIT